MAGTPRMDHLIQQHIFEHESRLKHMDELLARARQGVSRAKADGVAEQLTSAQAGRDTLASRIEEYRQRPPGQWSKAEFENKGPMIVWDTIAQQLEKLVERLEH